MIQSLAATSVARKVEQNLATLAAIFEGFYLDSSLGGKIFQCTKFAYLFYVFKSTIVNLV